MPKFRASLALVVAAFALSTAAPAAWAQYNNLPVCAVGLPVKDFLNYPAVIIAADDAKGSYQLRQENGRTYWASPADLRVNFSCRHVAKAPPPKSPDMFIGTWDLFIGSAWTTSYKDPDKIVYGPGGKGGGLVVLADGTYKWARPGGGVPIAGRWRELGPGPVGRNLQGPAIVLMKGQDGYDWQLTTQGRVGLDNREQYSLDQLPMGISIMATRM